MNDEEKIAALREALEKVLDMRFGYDGDCGVHRIAEDALAATVPTQSEASEGRDAWQPIETAPKDGTAILLAAGGVGIGKWVATFNSGAPANYWMSLRLESFMTGPVTHWMPLPAAPITLQSIKGESDEQG